MPLYESKGIRFCRLIKRRNHFGFFFIFSKNQTTSKLLQALSRFYTSIQFFFFDYPILP